MTPLTLPRVSRAAARARARLGNGVVFPFILNGEPGLLRMMPYVDYSRPCEATTTPVCRCEPGLMRLSAPGPILGLMADCPALPLAEHHGDAAAPGWYWSFYNQMLAAELQTLFGSLEMASPSPICDPVTVEWVICLGEARARSRVSLANATLCRLLDRPGWRPAPGPPLDLPLALPLILGTLTLALEELGALTIGDLLLPTTRFFLPTGEGGVRCGTVVLHGCLQDAGDASTHFYLTTMENNDVTINPHQNGADQPGQSDPGQPKQADPDQPERFDPDQPGQTDPGVPGRSDSGQPGQADPVQAWDAAPLIDASAFAPLPLLLSVRCGQLKMTLGALSRLAPGALLVVDDVAPGEAVLCHGDYTLAKGELVDVEGVLGLQITQVFSSCRDPVRGGA